MIKRLRTIVTWLESRFPEKMVVSAEAYGQQAESLDRVIDRAERLAVAHADYGLRLGKVEAAAVHKEAVQDLITVVKALQDDVTSLKASLGFNKMVQKQDEISAMLNGEVI